MPKYRETNDMNNTKKQNEEEKDGFTYKSENAHRVEQK
jgi:hypothetical protein